MKSGKLKKRITIYQLVEGSPRVDEFGEPNTSWELLATVWAAIEPVSGREFWAQQQVQSEISAKIRIRYRDDVVSGMKVEYAGKKYHIKNVIDAEEAHKELHLMVSEGVVNA